MFFRLNCLRFSFVIVQLPQQQNLYDCGLFLLHYAELFLEGNLVNFNPLKISSFSNFVSGLYSILPPSVLILIYSSVIKDRDWLRYNVHLGIALHVLLLICYIPVYHIQNEDFISNLPKVDKIIFAMPYTFQHFKFIQSDLKLIATELMLNTKFL